MSTVMILLVLLATAYTVYLSHTIRHDGYGVRPGPRSHPDDEFGRLSH